MLGVCRSSNLFEYVPTNEHSFDCPFTINHDYTLKDYYVTSGCLVWKKSVDGGSFYDPCRDKKCLGDGKLPIDLKDLTIPIPFDVRNTGSDEALGTWPITFLSVDDMSNERNAARVRMLSEWRLEGRNGSVPWRLKQEFVENIVSNGGRRVSGGVGNTQAGNIFLLKMSSYSF
jgi:hypothetical protein